MLESRGSTAMIQILARSHFTGLAALLDRLLGDADHLPPEPLSFVSDTPAGEVRHRPTGFANGHQPRECPLLRTTLPQLAHEPAVRQDD